ncbi:hypothetical protein [Segetibacter sp. 3557_3]|nr:hypothetical protein [Segetibacter sp. 3557_3]
MQYGITLRHRDEGSNPKDWKRKHHLVRITIRHCDEGSNPTIGRQNIM